MISPNGTVTPNFVTGPAVTTFRAGAISSNQLFLGGRLPTTGDSFAAAPLATGGTAALLPAGTTNVDAEFGGMAADAAGGFYATDAATGAVFQVSGAGAIAPVPAPSASATGVDLDVYGNLVFGLATVGSAGSFTAVMP